MAKGWTEAQVAKLREMYLANEPNSVIALKLRKTIQQVDSRIYSEARAGRLQREGLKARFAKRKRAHGAFQYKEEPKKIPTTTYEENGITVTVFPPMYARGVGPMVNL